MGFLNFINKLFKTSNKRDKLNTSRSIKVGQEQQDTYDMDDLDFDEMNDVWDEE